MEKFKFKIEGTEIDDLLRITRGEKKEEKKPLTIKCAICGHKIHKSLFVKHDFTYYDKLNTQKETQSYYVTCPNCEKYMYVHESLIKEEDNE